MRAQEALIAQQLDAAATVIAVQQRYAHAGKTIAQAALAGASTFEPLRHYPAGDVVDAENGTQFYYHAHDSSKRPSDEHGHFHLFSRAQDGAGFHHLAALSLDAHGWPIRWFTTNRWVTGERWLAAPDAIAMLRRFAPRVRGRMAPVARWLVALTRLYDAPLAQLLDRRDALLARRTTRGHDAERVFEDRRLDVMTECPIALPDRLAQVAALERPAGARIFRGDPS